MSKAGRLGFVAGLIPQEKLNGFERLLFRWVVVGCCWLQLLTMYAFLERAGSGLGWGKAGPL
jgi:hypothetical protein